MDDGPRRPRNHAGYESSVHSDGYQQVHLERTAPILVGQSGKTAVRGVRSAHAVDEDVDAIPLPVYPLDNGSRAAFLASSTVLNKMSD
jgi:hypothetical protein